MPKQPVIENVSLSAWSENYRDGDQVGLGWERGDARFHVWGKIKDGAFVPSEGPLYKNSLAPQWIGQGWDRVRHPDYFDTRKLDQNSANGRAMIETAQTAVRTLNLVQAMLDANAERSRQREAEHLEAVRKHRKQMAGEVMFGLLKEVLAHPGAADFLASSDGLYSRIDVVLAEIEGGAQ
jgi:hypothetical protein